MPFQELGDLEMQVCSDKQVEALEIYRQAVLQSMQDVEDTLVAYNREQVRLQSLRNAVAANQKAVDLSTEIIPNLLGRILCVETNGYHRDIGTPENLRRARAEFGL